MPTNEIVNNENDIIYFYSSDTIQAINESEPINFFPTPVFDASFLSDKTNDEAGLCQLFCYLHSYMDTAPT